MGIVSACVPMLRPLFTCIFHHARNVGHDTAPVNTQATLMDANGKVKSGAEDTASEKVVTVNERD